MIDNGTSTESLREQVMIAQLQGATGCTKEQARQLLQTARWEFETALSIFFQECTVPQQPQSAVAGATPTAPSMLQHHYRSAAGGHLGPVCAPCNTPATPPNFPEALLALQKLQAGSGSGADWSASSPPYQAQQQQQNMYQQTPKVLASFNPMPPPSDRYFQSCDWPTPAAANSPPKCNQFTSSTSIGGGTTFMPIASTMTADQHYSSNPFYLHHRPHQYHQMPSNMASSGMSENNSPMEGDDDEMTSRPQQMNASSTATFPIEAQQ